MLKPHQPGQPPIPKWLLTPDDWRYIALGSIKAIRNYYGVSTDTAYKWRSVAKRKMGITTGPRPNAPRRGSSKGYALIREWRP